MICCCLMNNFGIIQQVLNAWGPWAQYNPATFEDYFCHRFLISTLGESVAHPIQEIRFFGDCLQKLQVRESAVKIIKMRVISLCRRFPNITIQSEICQLLDPSAVGLHPGG